MINAVTTASPEKGFSNNTNSRIHRRLVRDTGYAALVTGSVCGIAGFKKVKFPKKMKVHKYCAYLAGAFSFLHLAFIKGLDKVFYKKNKTV